MKFARMWLFRSAPLCLGVLVVTLGFHSGCAKQVQTQGAPVKVAKSARNSHIGLPDEQAANQPNARKNEQSSRSVAQMKPNARASEYLAMGLDFYNNDQRKEATEAFALALAAGTLNNPGRALAYWHLFLTQADGNLPGAAADALMSFITVSRDILADAAGEPEDQNTREFVEGFNLVERLMFSEVLLEAIWARRDDEYGRTPERPVLVATPRGQRLFLQLFGPCEGLSDGRLRVEFQRGGGGVQHNAPVDKALVHCPGTPKPISLYFSTDSPLVANRPQSH